MIYVLAGSGPEATRFVVNAYLPNNTRIFTASADLDGVERFEEEDEVYLVNAGQTLTQVANKIYGRSWPRPHLFKHITLKRDTVPVG